MVACSCKFQTLSSAVWTCLNHYAYKDALYISEIFFNEQHCEESLFLLATCYYRNGQANSAYLLLRKYGVRTPEAKYLFARCCVELEKYAEAEELFSEALAKDPSIQPNALGIPLDHESRPFCANLLGSLCAKTARPDLAIELFRQSYSVNPFIISSIKGACAQGADVHVEDLKIPEDSKCFACTFSSRPESPEIKSLRKSVPSSPVKKVDVSSNIDMSHSYHRETRAAAKSKSSESINGSGQGKALPALTSLPRHDESISTPQTSITGPFMGLSASTVQACPVSSEQPVSIKPVPKAPRKGPNSRIQTRGGVGAGSGGSVAISAAPQLVWSDPDTPGAPRRSVRLQSKHSNENSSKRGSPGLSVAHEQHQRMGGLVQRNASSTGNNTHQQEQSENERSPRRISSLVASTCISRQISPRSKTRAGAVPSSTIENQRKDCSTEAGLRESNSATDPTKGVFAQKSNIEYFLELVKQYLRIDLSLIRYEMDKTWKYLNQLPLKHLDTAFAHRVRGRLYFEKTQYAKAIDEFMECINLANHTVAGLEHYSTALWQLGHENELSRLAQELTENFKLTPQAWIAAGNCFSLQKEQETSIMFFERAVQVDPECVYAHNLLGIEYMEMEDYYSAMQCFRSAIRLSPRSYNAWYGLGSVMCQMGKFDVADKYYRKALSLHRYNPVLIAHVSLMLSKQKRFGESVRLLDYALNVCPNHPLCLYQKAENLVALQQFEKALEHLQHLVEIVPKESKVYLLMGKVYKKLGKQHLALMNFSWATDLDPKGGVRTAAKDHLVDEPVMALPTTEQAEEEEGEVEEDLEIIEDDIEEIVDEDDGLNTSTDTSSYSELN